ncbi:MAG: hypothetical protein R8K50_02615, partial [Mariprofundus sp.]
KMVLPCLCWNPVMPDAFIWYHAEQAAQPALVAWLQMVETNTGIRGKLFMRHQHDKTTFMESYADVSTETMARIEKLAAQQAVFAGINRRCESFTPVRIDDRSTTGSRF